MKKYSLLLITFFSLAQLFFPTTNADVIFGGEDLMLSKDNQNKRGIEKVELVSGGVDNVNTSSDAVYSIDLDLSQKKIQELSLIIENQRQKIDKLQINYEALEDRMVEQKPRGVNIDYTNWVSLLLACLSVMVTIFGVVMAIISIIGIKNIKAATNTIAQDVSTKVAQEVAETKVESHLEEITVAEISKLISNGTLRPHLEQAVDMILRSNDLIQGTSGFNQFPEIDEDIDNESV